MKRIVILGHSLSALKAVEALRANAPDLAVTVLGLENTVSYYRHYLPDMIVKKLSPAKILVKTLAEWQDEQVTFILDKKPSRINFKRQRLTLDDKEVLEYDTLLLGDFLPQNFANIKGNNKNGIFNLKRFSGVTDYCKWAPVVETVVIVSDHIAGLKTAFQIAQTKKKEVLLVTRYAKLLGESLSDQDAQWLEQQGMDLGIRFFKEQQLAELLGDHDLKAVRLSSGKVFGCQAALTDAEEPDLRLLKETDLVHSQRVMVNEFYQTNFQNVFALDAVCDRIPISDWDVAENYQTIAEDYGRIVASRITGQEYIPIAGSMHWTLSTQQGSISMIKEAGSLVIQAQNELAAKA